MENKNKYLLVQITIIVALGGLLMGFDASVISGVVKFIEIEFALTKLQLGWAVACLTFTSAGAMLFAGPISDLFGRRVVLRVAAILYAISAIMSAYAPTFDMLVIARMIGGLGVGASLILAPMYIAEIAPPDIRGRLVSVNQLNIVIGISLAFFTNYLILIWGDSDSQLALDLGIKENNWRWMLGLETLPAVLYFLGLFFVPRSPRWLMLKGKYDRAREILEQFNPKEQVKELFQSFEERAKQKAEKGSTFFSSLKKMRLVLTIGIVIAILQQITGINAVFFYAPTIFEQAGLGTDASFVQAILVGVVNLVFTVIAMATIDKFGRRPLLLFGVAGIAISMSFLGYFFNSATYSLTPKADQYITENAIQLNVESLQGKVFEDEKEFKAALAMATEGELKKDQQEALVKAGISINSLAVILAILAFVASFAVSVGPVMWVLFSELFPNSIRGVAISVVGLINSAVSFVVQLVFPWELEVLGSDNTFFIYAAFAVLGWLFIVKVVPETKGKSLEELEAFLVK